MSLTVPVFEGCPCPFCWAFGVFYHTFHPSAKTGLAACICFRLWIRGWWLEIRVVGRVVRCAPCRSHPSALVSGVVVLALTRGGVCNRCVVLAHFLAVLALALKAAAVGAPLEPGVLMRSGVLPASFWRSMRSCFALIFAYKPGLVAIFILHNSADICFLNDLVILAIFHLSRPV